MQTLGVGWTQGRQGRVWVGCLQGRCCNNFKMPEEPSRRHESHCLQAPVQAGDSLGIKVVGTDPGAHPTLLKVAAKNLGLLPRVLSAATEFVPSYRAGTNGTWPAVSERNKGQRWRVEVVYREVGGSSPHHHSLPLSIPLLLLSLSFSLLWP